MMKVLVSGSRDMPENQDNRQLVYNAICTEADYNIPWPEMTIITGGARGADTIAHDIAVDFGAKTIVHNAEWHKFGNSAGPIRNNRMLDEEPDVVIAFPIGKSTGTRHCIREAKKRGIKTIVLNQPKQKENNE